MKTLALLFRLDEAISHQGILAAIGNLAEECRIGPIRASTKIECEGVAAKGAEREIAEWTCPSCHKPFL